MKTKLLTAFLFLIATSTQTLAARPSIAGLDAKLDTLIAQVEELTTASEYGKITLFGDLPEGGAAYSNRQACLRTAAFMFAT